jgi:hypothetical protein
MDRPTSALRQDATPSNIAALALAASLVLLTAALLASVVLSIRNEWSKVSISKALLAQTGVAYHANWASAAVLMSMSLASALGALAVYRVWLKRAPMNRLRANAIGSVCLLSAAACIAQWRNPASISAAALVLVAGGVTCAARAGQSTFAT